MPEEPRKSLTPAQLSEVLDRLDQVMAEAARLRRQITKEMAAQRRRQQQKLSPVTRLTRKRSS